MKNLSDNKPLVSLITICFNSEATIKDTINSVINQDYTNLEYILIDGESKDGTISIINSFEPLFQERGISYRYISEADNGLYDAMNKGVKLAIGSIVGIINSDDFYSSPQVITKVVDLLSGNSNAQSVYADLVYVDAHDTNKIIRYWKSGSYKKCNFYFGWMPPHPTFFAKKEVYDKYGCFNTDLRQSADYEIMLRFLLRNEISVIYLPEIIIKMRTGGTSNVTLSNRIRANNEDKIAWKINGIKPYFFTLWMKPLRKIIQFIRPLYIKNLF